MLQEEQKEEKDWQHNIIAKIKHFIRIKTSKEFDGVYGHSTKVWHTPYFVLFYQRLNSFKVGFVASKKMGNAVHRNRAKRLLRAHFIENIDCLKSGSYVLVAKSALLNESYLVIRKAYLHTLKKCTAL
ncbi:MAG: ribonuclease P protein component [Sulfurovum sp.]|nr:ribonuclease P protein component [Sulfurovum sp.]MCB4744583.1 ribonuclease P protein component [Sulfurovum sp.]MCB4747012.1 ribonuclease P protein component [Sulfurovum sp.]MCB4750693.1 ribonuclease P protein component [Sulfurovum sp.]MCB4751478.1 ribonuclease P protein component [Sulfurovum sp.]